MAQNSESIEDIYNAYNNQISRAVKRVESLSTTGIDLTKTVEETIEEDCIFVSGSGSELLGNMNLNGRTTYKVRAAITYNPHT